jgi:hypothetical protein
MKLSERVIMLLRRAEKTIAHTSKEEREFVRQFGSKPVTIMYAGRADMVGLRVLGSNRGFRIEQGASGRYLRAIEIVNGRQVLTSRKLRLRFRDSQTMLVPGVRSWVQ